MKQVLIVIMLGWLLISGSGSITAAADIAGQKINSDKIMLQLSLFDQAEQDYIASKQGRVFLVGVAEDYIPIEYVDETGRPRGMGVELLRKVHQLTGLEFSLYAGSGQKTWREIMQAVAAGEVDILSTVSLTAERQPQLLFSRPYMETTQVIVGDKSRSNLFGDITQIATGSVFAVPQGYWFLELVKDDIPQAVIIETQNMEQALRYVATGKADYTICEIPVFTYYKEQGLYNEIRIVGELSYKNQLFVGVRPEHQILLNIIDKVLNHISYAELYETSLVIPQSNRKEKHLAILATILAALLILVVVQLWRTFKKLLRSKQAAEAANRDKTRLMTNIAHDIRTPLTIVLGYAQALLELQVEQKCERQRYIQKISDKVRYLSAIVDDFLLLARLEDNKLALNKSLVQIEQLLRQLVEDFALRAQQRQIKLNLQIDEHAASYKMIDAVKLFRALENITGNALCYTEPGGRVEVALAKTADDRLLITISDNGPGIAAADLPFVFDRYYRGKAAKGNGIGLGLYIAREIVRAHQGDISVESDSGGSRFIITIVFSPLPIGTK